MTTPICMHAILFRLNKPNESQPDAQRRWDTVAYDIERLLPKTGNISCSLRGCILILGGSDSPILSTAINHAVNHKLAYTLTFFEKATVWNYDPPTVTEK
jgi:hypothetical protein